MSRLEAQKRPAKEGSGVSLGKKKGRPSCGRPGFNSSGVNFWLQPELHADVRTELVVLGLAQEIPVARPVHDVRFLVYVEEFAVDGEPLRQLIVRADINLQVIVDPRVLRRVGANAAVLNELGPEVRCD